MTDAALRSSEGSRDVRLAHSIGRPRERDAGRPGERVVTIPAASYADLDVTFAPEGVSLPRQRSELLARAMNIALASTALVLLSPLFLLVALAIRFSSPGPVIYMQTRVGLDRRRRSTIGDQPYDRRTVNLGGAPFRMYKFRTMTRDAERGTGARWATRNDARVTRIGRVLRKTRIDELPQLFNVLRGDMNIVGPRPERPSIFARLSEEIAHYPLRQRGKPGITGWAQINHNYDSCLDDVREKVRYDLEYLGRQGITEDLRIIVKTVPVMLLRRGGW